MAGEENVSIGDLISSKLDEITTPEEKPEEKPIEDDKPEEKPDDEEIVEDKDDDEVPELVAKKSDISQARKEFKDVFKKYPEIESNYFLGKKFQEVFSTPEEAQEAKDTSDYFENLATSTLAGDPTFLFEQLSDASPEGFVRFAMSFLPTLNEKAPKLVEKILEPTVINLFANLGKVAERRQDKNLYNSVRYCMRELFGEADIPNNVKIDKMVRNDKPSEREVEFTQKQDEAFYNSIDSVLTPSINTEIDKYFSSKKIPDGLKSTLRDKIRDEVFDILKANKAHMKTMQTMWAAARKSNYSDSHKRNIARAVYQAAIEIIPAVTKKEERRAFGIVKKDVQSDKAPGGSNNTGRFGDKKKERVDINKIDFRKTSLRDALDFDEGSDRIVLKK